MIKTHLCGLTPGGCIKPAKTLHLARWRNCFSDLWAISIRRSVKGVWVGRGWAVWSWDWVEKDVPWLVDSWKCWEVLWESRSQVNISLSDSLPRFYQNMFTFALSTFFFCFNSWLHFHLTCLLFQSKENIYKWRCLKMIHECPFIKKKKLVEFTDAYLLNMNSVAHK